MGFATDAIASVLHSSCSDQYSIHRQQSPSFGAIFMVRSKEALSRAQGRIATSFSSCQQVSSMSHWTPNNFRSGKYTNPQHTQFMGHSENNLKQINSLVVDADFGNNKPAYSASIFDSFVVQQLHGREIWPTMILETPHGYQAYFVLDSPVFLKRNGEGKLPALLAAKHVSQTLRASIAQALPQVDQGANHFGFFRSPNKDNIRFYEPNLLHSFKELLSWSKKVGTKLNTTPQATKFMTTSTGHRHTKQPWFQQILSTDVQPGSQNGLGRNNTLLTILLAMYADGESPRQALGTALSWNAQLTHPLTEAEINVIWCSAYSGNYQGPTKAYISQLLDQVSSKGQNQKKWHNWVKNRKERADRKNVHTSEWAQDIREWFFKHTNTNMWVKTTTRELQNELNIKPSSLLQALDYLTTNKLLIIKRRKGSKGGIFFTSPQHIQATKGLTTIKWTLYLNPTQAIHTHHNNPLVTELLATPLTIYKPSSGAG